MNGSTQYPFPHYGTCLPDYPVTYVTNEAQGDVHVFVPDGFDPDFIRDIANNFSHRIQEPVIVYHDDLRRKFRLCPAPSPHPDGHDYGAFVFSCDVTVPRPQLGASPVRSEPIHEQELAQHQLADHHMAEPQIAEPQLAEPRIPRPPNSWILYRQAKSRQLTQESTEYAGMTASELSTVISRMWHDAPIEEREYWQARAKEEERIHKEMYPGYKYTTRRSVSKAQK